MLMSIGVGFAAADRWSLASVSSVLPLPLADRIAWKLARTATEANSTLATPTVRSRPTLKIPQWREIIKLPKPAIEDSDEKTTDHPVLCGRGEGRRALLASSVAVDDYNAAFDGGSHDEGKDDQVGHVEL
jgi:hypothetical protein